MNDTRWDETWHRLRDWTNGQTPSERLAAQILLQEGFTSIDPSHPLGGRDNGKDARCIKDAQEWVMAVFFPRGQLSWSAIKRKFEDDVTGAQKHSPHGVAFVTNQELTLSERQELIVSVVPLAIELYHLERITAILDSPPMAEVRKQFLGIDRSDKPTILLGGQGGMAPGAGGGGGAALGDGALGGDGGQGGKLILMGTSGVAPGSGGGGEGATGNGAQGGQGGSGGDQVHVEIGSDELAALRQAGFDRIDFRVGMGGKSGGPGEDSIANFVTKEGKVLKSIVAKGGRPGDAPHHIYGRIPTSTDFEAGLKVSTLTLAECAQVKNSLLYLLGAGWSNFEFATNPFQASWPLVCTVDTGPIQSESVLAFKAIVKDPNGFQALDQPFAVPCGLGLVTRSSVIVPISFTGSQAGIWTIEIVAGEISLAQIAIEVRMPPVAPG